ncbi:unnamed protein product, partial [marine sediment metagenome]
DVTLSQSIQSTHAATSATEKLLAVPEWHRRGVYCPLDGDGGGDVVLTLH